VVALEKLMRLTNMISALSVCRRRGMDNHHTTVGNGQDWPDVKEAVTRPFR
jgi:hypothetical protein